MSASARGARDGGLARVAGNNSRWMEKALAMLPRMREQYTEVTGEEMRVWLLARELGHPTKPNAWGALTRLAVSTGLLVDTGRVRQMFGLSSHARRTPVWKIVV